MGTSTWQHISYNIDIIKKINPSSILDIGVGFGRWGVMYREYLDYWAGRILRRDWTMVLDGIEVYPKYIKKYHKYFYSKIYYGDAYYVIDKIKKNYDLAILGDVFEHFEKDKAIDLMKRLLKKSKYILLNLPLGENWEQAEGCGNIHERHLSFWESEEIIKLFPVVRYHFFKTQDLNTYAVYVISDLENASSVFNPYSDIESRQIEQQIIDDKNYLDLIRGKNR